jgi:hypothetical protein
MRLPILLIALLSLVATSCGARTGLPDENDSGAPMGGAAAGGERSCLPTCTIGHQCCVGGCDGPPAELPNDCCTCIEGEVDSRDCDDDDGCGG